MEMSIGSVGPSMMNCPMCRALLVYDDPLGDPSFKVSGTPLKVSEIQITCGACGGLDNVLEVRSAARKRSEGLCALCEPCRAKLLHWPETLDDKPWNGLKQMIHPPST